MMIYKNGKINIYKKIIKIINKLIMIYKNGKIR